MTQLLIYSLLGGVVSLAGGLLLLWKEKLTQRFINPLMAVGAGAFLSASFLDILPEALEMSGDPHQVLTALLGGFTLFFILERVGMRFKKTGINHIHSEHTETLPFLLILGDAMHNFLDGIIIALAYVANPALGLSTTLAVAAHEIPQEIGDFSILLKLKFSKKFVLGVNLMQSLLTIPGVLAGYYIGQSIEPYLPLLLGATSGIFIYIAATDLIPELHHSAGHSHFFKVIAPFISSILLVGYLTNLAH